MNIIFPRRAEASPHLKADEAPCQHVILQPLIAAIWFGAAGKQRKASSGCVGSDVGSYVSIRRTKTTSARVGVGQQFVKAAAAAIKKEARVVLVEEWGAREERGKGVEGQCCLRSRRG